MWQAFNMSFTVVVMFITVFHSLEMDLQCFRYHFMIHLPIKDSLGLRKPLHFLTLSYPLFSGHHTGPHD